MTIVEQGHPARKHRRQWPLWILPFILLAGWIWLRVVPQAFPARLQIGPDTTVVDGPLLPNGCVDYVAVLNDQASAGVTIENNAAVLIAQAIGPEVIRAEVREQYFQALGINVPSIDGDYLKDWTEFLRSRGLWTPGQERMVLPYAPFTQDQAPAATDWIKASEKPLELIVEASQCEKFFDPIVRAPGTTALIEAHTPLLGTSRIADDLLYTRAMFRLGSGDVAGACDDALSLQRLARLIGQHPSITGLLHGYGFDETGNYAIERIILSGQLTEGLAQQLRSKIESLPPFPELIEKVNRPERFWSLDMQLELYDGGKSGYDPNLMLRIINEAHDEVKSVMMIKDARERLARLDELETRFEREAEPTTGKLARDFCLAMAIGMRPVMSREVAEGFRLTIVPKGPQEAEVQHLIERELIRVGCALAEFHAAHGEYPAQLIELVPKYLPEIPLDLYTNQTLQYVARHGTFLLYSVGPNGIDDGGVSPADTNSHDDADDIRFGMMLPFPFQEIDSREK